MLRKPPDILITTPESLYLMMTSRAREILTDVEALIVDEIHAVAPTKRGAHMALTLERLERTLGQPTRARAATPQRIGLSATQRPLERIAQVPRRPEPRVRDRRRRRPQGDGPRDRRPGRGHDRPRRPAPTRRRRTATTASPSIPGPHRPGPDRCLVDRPEPALDLAGDLPGAAEARPRAHLDDHLRQQPPRRRADGQAPQRDERQRAARGGAAGDRARGQRRAAATEPAADSTAIREIARAHHGSLAREERQVVEELLKSGQLPCLVATSSLELGIDMGARRPGDPGRVAEVGRPRDPADRPRRPRARRGLEGPDLPQVPRRPARVRGRRQADARPARSRRR